MKSIFKIGIVQAKVPFSGEEGELNIIKFVRQAKEKQVDILGLPEDCLCGLFQYLEDHDPLKILSRIAREYNINLFGSSATLERGKYYSTGFYIDRTGKVISKVHKIVLTRPSKDGGFSIGKELQIFDTAFGRMSVLVCKDAFSRYSPLWIHELKKRGVEYLLVPSMSLEFDGNSVNFWLHSMWLLARWFDIYIFAPGTVGKNYTPYPSFGNALIVDRDKGFMRQGSKSKEELLIANILVRRKGEIQKDYQSKWDPVVFPQVKIKKISGI